MPTFTHNTPHNGYSVYADGLIEQWGVSVASGGSESGYSPTINLFVKMSNSNYSIIAINQTSESQNVSLNCIYIAYNGVDSSYFKIANAFTSNNFRYLYGIRWAVKGY